MRNENDGELCTVIAPPRALFSPVHVETCLGPEFVSAAAVSAFPFFLLQSEVFRAHMQEKNCDVSVSL